MCKDEGGDDDVCGRSRKAGEVRSWDGWRHSGRGMDGGRSRVSWRGRWAGWRERERECYTDTGHTNLTVISKMCLPSFILRIG